MKKVAISACLLGESCRYDGTDNRNVALIEALHDTELVPFCPEDFAFGTPRPTMDLIAGNGVMRAISNETGDDLSEPIVAYAKAFFEAYPGITLFIGKDRSPSCGVCSAKCYDETKVLIKTEAAGLMAAEAQRRGITSYDAEIYLKEQL